MGEFNPNDYQYEKFIVSEIEEGVRHVQFNNPKNLNAFNEKTWRDYEAILTKLDKDENTAVIVISSTVSRAFCSGIDLKYAMNLMESDDDKPGKEKYNALYSHLKDFQWCIGTAARIETPTIALLNGINYGLAIDLASSYTVRVATADSKFSIKEIQVGLTADMGTLQRMPRLVNNVSRLNELTLTGEIFKSDEALSLGYVSKVFPDVESGLAYVKSLASNINGYQNWAVKGTKVCIQQIIEGVSARESLEYVAELNSRNLTGFDVESIPKAKF